MSETTATTKPAGSSAKNKPTMTESQRFFDALSANQKLMWKVFEDSRKRGIRFSDALTKNFVHSQEAASALVQKLALNPRDYKGNASATIDAVTESQNRSMELLKMMLVEYTEGREAARENMAALYESGREIAASSMEMAQPWMASNPFVEPWQKTLDGFKKMAEATRSALA